MSINKNEQVTQEKIGMTHGSSSFTLRLKTYKVKFFHKRCNQEILKSTHLANHRKNPLISTWLLFFPKLWSSQLLNQILKIQCQYVLMKAGKWISYETYCLKVSLGKKLILSQFSQKEITIFFLFKLKQKQKKLKNRKKNPTYSFSPPHLFQKKCPWWTYFGEETKKFVTYGSIWPYVKIYFL